MKFDLLIISLQEEHKHSPQKIKKFNLLDLVFYQNWQSCSQTVKQEIS
jgi:hypothetical protein